MEVLDQDTPVSAFCRRFLGVAFFIGALSAIGLGFGIGLVFCAILIGLAWLYGGTP